MLKKLRKIYSLNFDVNKRKKSDIKFIILHYTGMKNEKQAISRLISNNSKVSCHYFIKYSGEILTLVPDLYISWHAGKSQWETKKFLNLNSIGIEISNPGHENNYKDFNIKQINSLILLVSFLKKKYKIKKSNILGHSDIAPDRKKDPGEKFPWKLLSKKKICLWHRLSHYYCKRLRKRKLTDLHSFDKLLFKFGYKIPKNLADKTKVYKSFQRRFRPELISNFVDEECKAILKSLN